MIKKILVIHLQDQLAANQFCNQLGADGDSFTVELYDSKNLLAGYWCGWNMTDEQLAAIQSNDIFEVFDTSSEALEVTGWHVQSE